MQHLSTSDTDSPSFVGTPVANPESQFKDGLVQGWKFQFHFGPLYVNGVVPRYGNPVTEGWEHFHTGM